MAIEKDLKFIMAWSEAFITSVLGLEESVVTWPDSTLRSCGRA